MSADNSNVLDLNDLAEIEVIVKWNGVDYKLREATEDAVNRYRDALLEKTRVTEGGKLVPGKGMSSVESMLLSLCLYDQDDKLVPLALIRTWPSRVCKAVMTKLEQISELAKKDDTVADLEKKLEEAKAKEDSVKNESSGTKDGSA